MVVGKLLLAFLCGALLSSPTWAVPSDAEDAAAPRVKRAAAAEPSGTVGKWVTIVDEQFDGNSLAKRWVPYWGRFGNGSYPAVSHASVRGGQLHLLAKYEEGGTAGPGWYTAGVCLCGDQSLSSVDARVTVRYRVANSGAANRFYYAFMRWPDSDVWPRDGEEDFAEGAAWASAGHFLSALHSPSVDGSDTKIMATTAVSRLDQWHTITYTMRDFRAELAVDGVVKQSYVGNAKTLPPTMKHVVLQLECDHIKGCPRLPGGSMEVLVDSVKVEIPG